MLPTLMFSTRRVVHIQTTEVEAPMMKSQIPTIITLIKGCKHAAVVTDVKQVPLGCGSAVINADCTVHVLVKVSRGVTLSIWRTL